MNALQFFDQYTLASLREIMEEDFPALLQTYRDDVLDKFQTIESSKAAGETLLLKKTVHSLKGSSGNVGVMRLIDICQHIEELCVRRLESVDADAHSLRQLEDRVTFYLSALLELKEPLLKEIDLLLANNPI
ncbi:Hpt domain-containing protein [Sessilibacter sp. MAH2]